MPTTLDWEYRVQSIGSMWGTKDELVEDTLNEWGEEGWEVVSAFTSYGNGKVTVVAKRPLPPEARRRRSWPE
jgi:hypothetical protein